MRLWIFSDLHLEYADLPEPLAIPEADVCVVAGDLCNGPANGVRWLAKHVAPAMPCVYVAGNHEFYKGSIKEGLEEGRAEAEGFANIHFLENDFVVIDRIRFVGATLWTDYGIEGHSQLAMSHARERMNDHRKIAYERKPWKRFVPEIARRIHFESQRFIETALKADPIRTVVVTHHLPHPKSLSERFKGDLLNAAYASDLTDIIEAGRPAMWFHGHVHECRNYRILETVIVSNPRGYGDENVAFDPALVVEV
jgi:predicted phosphohydrolase